MFHQKFFDHNVLYNDPTKVFIIPSDKWQRPIKNIIPRCHFQSRCPQLIDSFNKFQAQSNFNMRQFMLFDLNDRKVNSCPFGHQRSDVHHYFMRCAYDENNNNNTINFDELFREDIDYWDEREETEHAIESKYQKLHEMETDLKIMDAVERAKQLSITQEKKVTTVEHEIRCLQQTILNNKIKLKRILRIREDITRELNYFTAQLNEQKALEKKAAQEWNETLVQTKMLQKKKVVFAGSLYELSMARGNVCRELEQLFSRPDPSNLCPDGINCALLQKAYLGSNNNNNNNPDTLYGIFYAAAIGCERFHPRGELKEMEDRRLYEHNLSVDRARDDTLYSRHKARVELIVCLRVVGLNWFLPELIPIIYSYCFVSAFHPPTPAELSSLVKFHSSFHVGLRLDVYDDNTTTHIKKWYACTVVDVCDSKIRVRFDDYDESWDQWFHACNNFLAPLGTHTSY